MWPLFLHRRQGAHKCREGCWGEPALMRGEDRRDVEAKWADYSEPGVKGS